MSPHELALVQRWNESKDPDAFAEIVQKYAGLVYGACLRVLRNADDAEDVAQECFMKLAEAPVNVRDSLGGWFHTMATRRAINKLRSDSRREAREEQYAALQPDVAEAVWDDVQHLIDEAIAGLPDDLRVPVIEHYLMARTLESIGEDLEISRQAVSRRVQKGVNKVREDLRKKGIPVAPAVFSTGIAEIGNVEPSEGLRTGLMNSGIGGVDASTLAHVIDAKASAPFVLSPLLLKVIPLLLIAGGVGIWGTSQLMSSPPPSSQTPIAAGANGSDQDAEVEAAQTVLAQNRSTDTNLPAVSSVARTPDFTTFAEDRPTPPPGVGGFLFHIDAPNPIDMEMTLTLVIWHPWEDVPTQRVTFRNRADRDGLIFFENLPLGTYHMKAKKGNLGGHWRTTISQAVTGAPLDFAVYPSAPIVFHLRNERGEPVQATQAYIYQHRLIPGIVEFPMTALVDHRHEDDGTFVIEDMTVGAIRAFIRAPGYAPSLTDWVNKRAEPFPVVMTQGSSFSARVVTESGEPLEGGILYVRGDYFGDHGREYTDADGAVTIPHLRAGDYRVGVYHEQYVLRDPAPTVTIGEEGTSAFGEITVVPGTDIDGVVVDEETGDGIPGIRLSIESETGIPIEDVVTDASGYYTIRNAAFARYEVTRAFNTQFGPAAGRNSVTFTVNRDGIEGETDFALSSGIPVSARLLDSDGKPVRGAMIGVGYAPDVLTRESNSDRFGHVSFNSVREPGEIYVQARALGFGRVLAGPFEIPEEGVSNLEIRMPHAAGISGSVRIDGKFAPFQTYVQVLSTDPDAPPEPPGDGKLFVRTGPVESKYFITWIPPGSYDLLVRPPGGSLAPAATFTVREGQFIGDFDVDFSTSGLALAGSLRDRSGAPIVGAQMFAMGGSGGNLQTQSNGDGEFSFVGLGEGIYTIVATHGNHSRVQLEGVEAPNERLRIEMPGRGSVLGRVVSSVSSQSLDRFQVAQVSGRLSELPAKIPSGRIVSSDDGRFELDDVELGTATLIISAADHAPAMVHVEDVRENRASDVGRISLKAAAILSGVIADAEGNAVQGAFIHAPMHHYAGESQSFDKTDYNGRFNISTLQEGTHALVVSHPDYALLQFDATLRHGDETELQLVVYGGAEVVGTVYADGAPTDEAYVALERVDGTIGRKSVQTDASGQYRFEKIPAGDYTLTVSVRTPDGFMQSSDPFPIAFGDSGTQLLDWTF